MSVARPRLRVLLSAYACEPGRGSEPAVGWNLALALAREHEVWVLTRANQRAQIERALAARPGARPRFVYLDLPGWARFWKRGTPGVALYYYLWQWLAYRRARTLQREVGFDLAHHVTFVTCSLPSLLVRLPVPLVWGPVGGSEPAPPAFLRGLGWRGRRLEAARRVARWLADRDPLLRRTARGAALALASTTETAARLRALGAADVRVVSQVGIGPDELPPPRARPAAPFRVVSSGRLLAFKGFHLGLRAFAQADVPGAEYWIVGDGPERARLERLARELGLGARVRFWGALPRAHALQIVSECHVLVHPTLHESGGLVCGEALALGCPVIALELGGPALQVKPGTGWLLRAGTPEQVVSELAAAIARLAHDPALWSRCSAAGRAHAAAALGWNVKAEAFAVLYRDLLGVRDALAR